MSKLAKALTAAAGNAGGTLGYVEDVFSTYLYTGNGATRSINNGIDLAGEGGMVFLGGRGNIGSFFMGAVYDTERGATKFIRTNTTSAETTDASQLISFNPNGFSLGSDSSAWYTNYPSENEVSWTFRKAEKFFDVVTYTGNGTAGHTISHNLGAVPAVIIVKRLDGTGNWAVYHKDADATSPEDKYLFLNSTAAVADAPVWNDYAPTDTDFQVGSYPVVNNSGSPFVAYLFASDAGGFGDDGSENIIKCGSFTLDGSGNASIDCGFEPQWVLAKRTDGAQDWYLTDMMRGMAQTTNGSGTLSPNLSDAEYMYNRPKATATGFDYVFIPNTTYIYIAIRRPMKTPESGTEVFNSLAYTGDGASTRDFDLGMTVDAYFQACRSSSTYDFKNLTARLTAKGLHTAGTGTEFTTNTSLDVQDGLRAIGFENTLNQLGETYIINGFKRATGFFDVVAYTGNGVAGRTVAHNLGVAPEMMIVKQRSASGESWIVYHTGLTSASYEIKLNFPFPETGSTAFNGTAPTSSVFSVGGGAGTNGSGSTYIAYLFATLAGVSKVGSYTGTGSNVDVDCGFSAGARFVLIKRKGVDFASGWYVWDSVRGIVAGNDPYLLLNSTAAEVTSTDYIDPLSSGFTVTSTAPAALNNSGETYIFLAIA